MKRTHSFARPFAVALSLAFVAAPMTAFAEAPKAPAAAPAKKDGAKDRGDKHEKRAEKREERQKRAEEQKKKFPMDAAAFEKLTAERIEQARQKLVKRLEEHKVPEAVQKQIQAEFDKGTEALKAGVKAAVADGTVTWEEAKELRKSTHEMRRASRAKRHEGRARKDGAKDGAKDKAHGKRGEKAGKPGDAAHGRKGPVLGDEA